MPDIAYMISCEHAVNHVPAAWRYLFAGREKILDTHRAFDRGAFDLAQLMAEKLEAPCFAAKVTRLLVDHNRSPQNRSLWSEFSRGLRGEEKKRLLDDYYQPFRHAVGRWLDVQRENNRAVIHLSIHSFAPVLEGRARRTDIGLLYDPRRAGEKEFAKAWKRRFFELAPDLRVRRNHPYRGVSDSHQATYRRRHARTPYLALELEINQALVASPFWDRIRDLVAGSLPEKPSLL